MKKSGGGGGGKRSKKYKKKELWVDSPISTPLLPSGNETVTSGAYLVEQALLAGGGGGEDASGDAGAAGTIVVEVFDDDGTYVGDEGALLYIVNDGGEIVEEWAQEVPAGSACEGAEGGGQDGGGQDGDAQDGGAQDGGAQDDAGAAAVADDGPLSDRDARTITRRWKGNSRGVERGHVISTLALNSPAVRFLEQGFDLLRNIPDRFGKYSDPCPWVARNFANKFPSGFCSFSLADKLSVTIVNNANFVGDWENIKRLMTSTFNADSRSFLLHKIGKSVFVDHFDLKAVLVPPKFRDWPWLLEFALKTIREEDRSALKREGKEVDVIMNMAHFLKLLYYGVDGYLEFKKVKDFDFKEVDDPFLSGLAELLPVSNLKGVKKKFLNTAQIKVAGFSVLAGSDVPVFTEPNGGTSKTSMRLISREEEELKYKSELGGLGLDPTTAVDMWLDNILLGIPKVCIVENCHGTVLGSHVVETDDLPGHGSFDPEHILNESELVLQNVFNRVTEVGHTYWLYRPRDSNTFTLYDLTVLSALTEEHEATNEEEINAALARAKSEWVENPFQVAIGVYLCKGIVGEPQLYKLATFESMLRHAVYMLHKTQPMIKVVASILLYAARTKRYFGSHSNPIHYDWPEEMEFIFNSGLPEDLMTVYILLTSLEKLDAGDDKVVNEALKLTNISNAAADADEAAVAAANLAKASLTNNPRVDKNSSVLANFLWSRRQAFASKTSNSSGNNNSSFNMQYVPTHKPFKDLVAESNDKSTEAKKLRKMESLMKKEKAKNLSQNIANSLLPSLSDRQFSELKKIVSMTPRESAQDTKVSVKEWIEIVHHVTMAMELVLALKLLLTNKDKYDSVLTTRLEIHIKMALGKICYYIAMANTDLNLSGLTNLTYEILYGAPLMVELGKEISTFVADAMILNAKEVVYDSTKSLTALQGPPADEEAEKEGPFYMDFSKELVFIGQSRVYLNLPTIIENCVQKLTVEFTDFPTKEEDRKDLYPLIPKFSGNVMNFFNSVIYHLDCLRDYVPPSRLGAVRVAKEEVANYLTITCSSKDKTQVIVGGASDVENGSCSTSSFGMDKPGSGFSLPPHKGMLAATAGAVGASENSKKKVKRVPMGNLYCPISGRVVHTSGNEQKFTFSTFMEEWKM